MTFENKNKGSMHIWLVELKFTIRFLLNTVYMIHFERILTIFLHFLERVLDRPNFSIFTYILCVPIEQRKNLYPMLIFNILKKTTRAFQNAFQFKFGMLGSGRSLYQK
jgi:hypothetical protein